MLNRTSIVILFSALLFSACDSGHKPLDTPTSGTITIAADESFEAIAQAEVNTFNGLYKYATITPQFVSEQECFKRLMNDSVRLIITTRTLAVEESIYFDRQKLHPRATKIAYDALAIIVNKENPDTLFRYDELKEIFSGKVNTWAQRKPNSTLGEIHIVFDNTGSGNVRMIREKMLGNAEAPLPSNCFAAKTNPEVIDYVNTHKDALGIIGVSWVSDGDDTVLKGFLNKIKVAAVAPAVNMKGAGEYYLPFQAYIAQGVYPLIREVFVVSREARTGLGTGFASFIASDKGQRIILKSGMVPATMPIRLINIKSE